MSDEKAGLTFKIVTPSALEGHGVQVLENTELLSEWVDGINFSRIDSGPNAGGGLCVGVEGEVVNNAEDFWKEIRKIAERYDAGEYDRDEVEIMLMPRIVGG